jgi:hypothetical protein
MNAETRGFESVRPREDRITEKDLEGVPDAVLRWMARHARGSDIAVVGGELANRMFKTH